MVTGHWDQGNRSAAAIAGRRPRKRNWGSVIAAITAVVLTVLAVSVLSLRTLAPAGSGAHVLGARVAVAQKATRLSLPGVGHGRFYELSLSGALAPGERLTAANLSVRVANANALPKEIRITSAQGHVRAADGRWSDDFFIAISYPGQSGAQTTVRSPHSVELIIDSSAPGSTQLIKRRLTCPKADAKKWGTYRLENQTRGTLPPLARIEYAGAELVCEG